MHWGQLKHYELLRLKLELVRLKLDLRWASLGAQMVKDPPAMQETKVGSLDREDPLEKGMATHEA